MPAVLVDQGAATPGPEIVRQVRWRARGEPRPHELHRCASGRPAVLELFRHVLKGECRRCIMLRSTHLTQTHPASFEFCATVAAVPLAAKPTTRPTKLKASPPKQPPSSPPPPPAAALAPVVVAGGAHLRFQGFATKPTSGDYADTSVVPGAIQVVGRTINSSKVLRVQRSASAGLPGRSGQDQECQLLDQKKLSSRAIASCRGMVAAISAQLTACAP